jgi:hypothetical protein
MKIYFFIDSITYRFILEKVRNKLSGFYDFEESEAWFRSTPTEAKSPPPFNHDNSEPLILV